MAGTYSPETLAELERVALEVRRNVLRMTHKAGSGHPGGSLSCTDLLTALYFHELRVDPKNPRWPGRDRFVLSKGHAAPALYSVMAEKGFLPKEELSTLRELGSRLQGHVDAGKLPGIEASTGCLGQGISMAVGMALDARLAKRDSRVYAVLGDGECQEGETWEAFMAGAHFKLDNLTAIIDRNGIETDGTTEEIMALEPLADKTRAFGWHTLVVDGHSFPALLDAFAEAKTVKGRPTMIIAKTVKGKSVSFMENKAAYHGKPPSSEELQKGLRELGVEN
ncbi:MAG: transketolase [Euryarchaeota archaeon]|nr:transketolase [Euryarchaeota archaeon]MDE1837229.1 transketolase [Euryarchaeota archaeon]MDE1879840.1 transketolase [Euryarchaeota archaeon]MDE2045167.1 transketolase [Thermoplasmata archaeon]